MDKLKAVISPPSHMRFDRKNALVGLAVLIVLAGLGGWYVLSRPDKPPAKATTNMTLTKLYDGKLQLNDPSTRKELEAAYKTAQTPQDKINLLHALASSDIAAKQYQAAADHLLQAIKDGDKGTGTLLTLADNYKNNLHDNAKALKYYRLALDSANQDKESGADPYASDQLQYIQAQMKEVEAQGG